VASTAAAAGDGGFVCASCGTDFAPANGIIHFLSRERASAAEAFQRQYRRVRERDGFRPASPEYYRQLPSVGAHDAHATEWRIRAESFSSLRRHALPRVGSDPVHVLDLGAGSAWLSHHLAADGHRVVAVDRLEDEADGLGACRHYAVPFAAVQADFNALPFEPAQFDLVVFDGSLHYAVDPAATLGEAVRMLAPGGTVAVMDSPMFIRDRDGEAMVAAQLRQLEVEHGIRDPVRPGRGYLTFAGLRTAAGTHGLRGRFLPSRGPIGWRIGRQLSRVRVRRAPAAFGVWVAR
jgi:SAM-dependent methyltransferase